MADRRPERLAALRRKLADAQLDALLVTSLPNIRYLTGFSGSSAAVLVAPDEVALLSDSRYTVQAQQECGAVARVIIDAAGFWERLWPLLAERPAGKLGFEADHVTAREGRRIADRAKGWTAAPAVDLVESLRAVKAPEEVDAIRRAGTVATLALREAAAAVRVGQAELEVAAALEGALRRGGSEWFPFPTIVASGPRAALPHARTSDRRIEAGDLLLIDFGAIVDGYCSDITRTFVVGADPTPRQREIHGLVERAQRAALDGLRAGITGKAGDALARDPIEAAGHGPDFGHSLGHGLGLEVHEAPRLARTSERELPAGSVVTVEPGIYLEGWGGVRIEDDVVLTPDGAELLTEYERELVRLD